MSKQDLTTSIKRLNNEIISLKKEFAWELTFDKELQQELTNKRHEFNKLKRLYEVQYAA